MKKRIGSLVLAVSMILSLTACGSSTTGSTDSTTQTSASGTSQAAVTSEGPTTELNLTYLAFGHSPKDLAVIEKEINKISKEKINATVKITPLDVSNYAQQIKLMLTSNEPLDLFETGVLGPIFDYAGQSRNGQLYPLNDLIEKNGQGIKAAVGDYFQAGTFEGKLLAVPTLKDMAQSQVLIMRKDLVEKYKIDVTKISTLDDMEAVFKTIKTNEPEIASHMFGQDQNQGLDEALSIPGGDYMNDWFGVLLNATDHSLKLSNYFESKEFIDLCKRAEKWNKAGYLLPDTTTNTETAMNLMKAGKIFSFVQSGKPGIEGQVSRQTGVPVLAATIVPAQAATSVVTNFMWGVPNYAKNAEKAVQFLDLLYSDKDVINLIDWGIEGTHYVKTADGTIDYPAGVDAKTSTYNMNEVFVWGNSFLSHVWKGDAPDLYKQMDEFNKSAIKSDAFGFMFNSAAVKNEMTALQNVIPEYRKVLAMGAVSTDKLLPQFQKKLKDAGIDKVIAEKQKQLDEWAKNAK